MLESILAVPASMEDCIWAVACSMTGNDGGGAGPAAARAAA
jgi:hypothetical protein